MVVVLHDQQMIAVLSCLSLPPVRYPDVLEPLTTPKAVCNVSTGSSVLPGLSSGIDARLYRLDIELPLCTLTIVGAPDFMCFLRSPNFS